MTVRQYSDEADDRMLQSKRRQSTWENRNIDSNYEDRHT